MKVFISWSGARSRIVAEALRDWLPNVINAVEPFVSEEDIDKGAIGTEVIARQLHDSTFGIICLTRDNQTRPWINYEAGALSKVVGDNEARVATVLVDIESPAGVTGPLSAFQATRLNDLADMKQLVRSIAKAAGDTRSKEALDSFVNLIWSSLALEVTEGRLAASGEASAAPVRKPEDMFGELLTLMRQVSQDVWRLSRLSDVEQNESSGTLISKVAGLLAQELFIAGIRHDKDGKLYVSRTSPPEFELTLSHPASAELKSRLWEHANQHSVLLRIIESDTEKVPKE
ncbi:MAG: TIR domain-containing protein [Jatrophihabitantaceae bacterium]